MLGVRKRKHVCLLACYTREHRNGDWGAAAAVVTRLNIKNGHRYKTIGDICPFLFPGRRFCPIVESRMWSVEAFAKEWIGDG